MARTSDSEQAATAASAERYVVLARRYRPRQFDQVIGQQHVTRTLQNAIRAGRVHHAYLFTGSRGVGKTTVARILAKALNCEEGPTPTPCDRCGPCRESGSAVDVFEIDGASHTGVDDIRELRENVRYLPAQARNKIYIIDEVHMLSTSAFNALLKTLEEPPPHVVFIFATTEPHKIPATILSRCQRFDYKRVQVPDLVAHLQRIIGEEGVTVDQGGLALIARAAEGSVRDSLSLLDQVIAHEVSEGGEISAARVGEVLGMPDRRVLFELSAAVLARDTTVALMVIDRLFSQGQDLSQFAQAFLTHLRDLVVVRSCREPAALLDVTEVELDELGKQAGGAAAELLQQCFDRFARAAEEIARSSYPRLLLEMALLEMVNAEPLLPLGGLLERLEALEGRLGGASGPRHGGGGQTRGGQTRAGGGQTRGGQTRARGGQTRAGGGQTRAGGGFAPPRGGGARSPASSARPAGPATAPGSPSLSEPEPPPAPPVQASPAPPAAELSAAELSAAEPAAGSPAAGPPAAEPASPAGSNGAGGSLLARWQQLLKRVQAEQPVLASAYVNGRVLSWGGKNDTADDDTADSNTGGYAVGGGGTIEIGYPAGSFELTRAEDRERRATLAELCSRLVGQPIEVSVRAMKPEEEASPEVVRMSVAQEKARLRAERSEKLRQEAEGHPITRALVQGFGAKIQRIRTNVDGDER